MRASAFYFALAVGLAAFSIGCSQGKSEKSKTASKTIRVDVGPDAQKRAQTALINAKPGETIEFGAGKFDFDSTLSLEDVSHITIRGQGPDKTILSFANQQQGTGGEGLRIKCKEDILVENLAVEDAKGDAVKVQDTKKVIFRNVRAEWTGGPKETNGAYGLYPVLCSDVVIEDCIAIGASDAGVYVGQSENIIVRRCRAEKNVAGIEIENSVNADVYENTAIDNTGGILVFSLPDLPKKDGRSCRVFNNKVVENNHANFAPKGNIVATVPPGTGMMIMANDQVELFGNTVEKNNSTGLLVVSYLINQKPLKDEQYDPYCEAIYVHDNKFAENGQSPGGDLGGILGKIVGTPFPDIMYDGMRDPKKLVEGELPDAKRIRIRNNAKPPSSTLTAARSQPPTC